MSRPSLFSRSLTNARAIGWMLGLIALAPTVSWADVAEPSADEALLLACQQSLPCKTHLDKATQLYKQDRYDAALAEYQAAYVLQPFPLILYNIARIYHKQSQLSDAAAYYQRYLDTGHPDRAERARELLAQARTKRADEPPRSAPSASSASATPSAPSAPSAPSTPVVSQLRAESTPPAVSHAAPQPTIRTGAAPLYTKWWLWTLLAATVLGGAAGIAVGVYSRGPDVSGLPARTLDVGH